MSSGSLHHRKLAALDLAALLQAARVYVATTRPHVCCDCGHLFTLPSLMSGRRCARCGTTTTTT